MKRIGLLSFAVTTGVLVPTALHTLTAGPEQVAKLLAPDSTSLTIDGTKISASVDRSIADPGDQVTLTLASTGTKRTTVTVMMLESTGTRGGRVETPPSRTASHTITLEPNATKTVAMTMPGHRGREMDGTDPYGRYTILVMPPKAARTFEKLRVAAEGVDPMGPSGDSGNSYNAFEEAYASTSSSSPSEDRADPTDRNAKPLLASAGSMARLEVLTRPSDSPVSISTPPTHAIDDPFVVAVTVENSSNKPWNKVEVTLTTTPTTIREGYRGLGEDDATVDTPSVEIALPPHQAKTVSFRVTAKALGTVGLEARTNCTECEGWGYGDWALDATDIVKAKAPETTTVVGQR